VEPSTHKKEVASLMEKIREYVLKDKDVFFGLRTRKREVIAFFESGGFAYCYQIVSSGVKK